MLRTKRLHLRSNVKEDLMNLHRLLSDSENMYYLDDVKTSTIEQTARNLDHAIANADGRYFCIEDGETGEYIGQIGYTITDDTPLGKVVHLGYFILPKMQNLGYVTEAVEKVIEYAFAHDGCVRITTGCYKDNVKSARVMEKAGFRLEGEFVKAKFHDGVMKDRLFYAINSFEFFKSKIQEM